MLIPLKENRHYISSNFGEDIFAGMSQEQIFAVRTLLRI